MARSAIRVPAQALMQVVAPNEVPGVGPVPAAEKVLVLAPHMDDETIGCGGAIIAHVNAGAEVHVVYVTDGIQGFTSDAQRKHDAMQRREIRMRESEEACRVLGVHKTHYLDLPDGKSAVTPDAVARLSTVLESVQPDLLYLPFITDTHHDHRISNALLLAACTERWDNLLLNCYEVWTPLYPNHILDVTAAMDKKMAALACYESQLTMNNYLSSVRGLNAYRAIANRSEGFAEAFYFTTVGQYRALAQRA